MTSVTGSLPDRSGFNYGDPLATTEARREMARRLLLEFKIEKKLEQVKLEHQAKREDDRRQEKMSAAGIVFRGNNICLPKILN